MLSRALGTTTTSIVVIVMLSGIDLYADFGVFERLTQLDKAFPGANVLLFKQGKLPQVSCRCSLPVSALASPARDPDIYPLTYPPRHVPSDIPTLRQFFLPF